MEIKSFLENNKNITLLEDPTIKDIIDRWFTGYVGLIYQDTFTRNLFFTEDGKLILILQNKSIFIQDVITHPEFHFSKKGVFRNKCVLNFENEWKTCWLEIPCQSKDSLNTLILSYIKEVENNEKEKFKKRSTITLKTEEINITKELSNTLQENNSKILNSMGDFLHNLEYSKLDNDDWGEQRIEKVEEYTLDLTVNRYILSSYTQKVASNHGEIKPQIICNYIVDGNINSFYILFRGTGPVDDNLAKGNSDDEKRNLSRYYFPFVLSLDNISNDFFNLDHFYSYGKIYTSFNEFINSIRSSSTNNKIIDRIEFDKLITVENFIREVIINLQEYLSDGEEKVSKEMNLLDKNLDGVIDIIESDDFGKLLKKYQSKIKEIDTNHLHKFVKLSNYLKNRRNNIQSIFKLVSKENSSTSKINLMGILKNQIHNYEVLTVHSLNMIISLVEGEDLVFFEIYESLDKLNIFNSNWENEISNKLSEIEVGLSELMESIQKMEMSIVKGLNHLSYITESSFQNLQRSVTKELQGIHSDIKFNNLLTGIQTYQMYKINKNTKSIN